MSHNIADVLAAVRKLGPKVGPEAAAAFALGYNRGASGLTPTFVCALDWTPNTNHTVS
jgi:hypothetical protein